VFQDGSDQSITTTSTPHFETDS